uniref:Uncharacterized protein n=1 Tax=Anguilla anguilla TaxID=7936 RepID=A0A0E9VKX6_ANGAN
MGHYCFLNMFYKVINCICLIRNINTTFFTNHSACATLRRKNIIQSYSILQNYSSGCH